MLPIACARASLGDVQIVQRAGSAWLVGRMALPETEHNRVTTEMQKILTSAGRHLDSFKRFEMRHPSRGTPMYQYLELDGTHKHVLGYPQARGKAIAVAEKALPRVKQFIFEKADAAVLEIGAAIQMAANRHMQDLKDRPLVSYVLKAKYEALLGEVRQIFQVVAAGPSVSEASVVGVLTKKPVDARGMQASVEAMQNLHYVDEYQVICAVTGEFAAHADRFSMHAISSRVFDLVNKQEDINVPMQD